MNPAENVATRRDRVVIMARGLGSRMGAPKGLLRLSATGPAFVRAIADLYLASGFEIEVVTLLDTAPAYRGELPVTGAVSVLPAPDGGDTAMTLLTAWRSCIDAGKTCTHMWAQPVDLPLVAPATIGLLRDLSQRNPHRIIRPVCERTPGHPVILPARVLEVLAGRDQWRDGPLRDFLADAVQEELLPAPLKVEVADQGVVRDFDRPADFESNQSWTNRRGAP